jgi:hypothetical protein
MNVSENLAVVVLTAAIGSAGCKRPPAPGQTSTFPRVDRNVEIG